MAYNECIKVLSLCSSDSRGGAARVAVSIHSNLNACGVHSEMIVFYKEQNDAAIHSLLDFAPHNKLHDLIYRIGKKIRNLRLQRRFSRYPNQDKNYKSDLSYTYFYGALQKMEYDVLHLHWICDKFLSLDELPKVKKPIVWTMHDEWAYCGVCHYHYDCDKFMSECGSCPQLGSNDNNDLANKVWLHKKKIYEQLDLHIVCPSNWIANQARQSALLENADIRVIPNGIDTNEFRPYSVNEIENEFPTVRRDMPVIVYGAMSATTNYIKGFECLKKSLEILDKKNLKVQLVVFGAEEKDINLHYDNIEVVNVGYVSDKKQLAALYSLADVTVVPSLSENLSCVIMESLSCGTPVVAYNIGGNSDMIDHCQNGYIAKPQNAADFAEGIKWCLENNQNNKLGQNARKKVQDNFDIKVIAQKYAALYRELVLKNS